MKTYYTALIALLFITFSFNLNAQTYSRIEVTADRQQMISLLSRGLPVDDAFSTRDGKYIVELSDKEIEVLRNESIPFEILIDNVSAYYVERNEGLLEDLAGVKNASMTRDNVWPVPEGFELGPVGGFSTIDQMIAHLDDMIASYPDLISQKFQLNYQTHEGRDIFWVRISDNPNTNEPDEPEILYTGMHHAREPIGMQLLLFYMYHLLENYPDDPDAQYLIDNFELIFVPVINMDGYAYNIQTNPAGGGMWRKNRRDNGNGYWGVDPNRNYGYNWGYDNNGSSPYSSDETYRGPSPFSEPCVQAMRDFCEENEFVNALNYHSYSNLLLYPWGFTEDPCPDDAVFLAHSQIMTQENGYTYGAGSTTIYPTNGGSDDWMYGEQDTKDLIYSYTPEVGGSNDGFWPAVDRIIPLCQENMWQNIMAAKLAGPFAFVDDMNPSIVEDVTGVFNFEIKRLGLMDDGIYTVSIVPLNDAISEIGEAMVYNDLDILQEETGAISFTLKEDIQQGDEIRYALQVNNGYVTETDTISKVYGTPVVVFEDEAETFEKWASNKWNTTSVQVHSGEHSIADSPFGSYSNYENNSVILTQPIDLTEAVYASLSFWAMWDIEAGYDYVQVYASDDNGSTWTPLEGNYTKPGNSNQATDEPLYDGVMEEWVKEDISLADFIGGEVVLRFRLKSDTYVTGDGFYWDDMEVVVIDIATGIGEGKVRANDYVKVFPNPAVETVSFEFEMPAQIETGEILIFDAGGQKVGETTVTGNSGKADVNIADWPAGIYYYMLRTGHSTVATGKLVKR